MVDWGLAEQGICDSLIGGLDKKGIDDSLIGGFDDLGKTKDQRSEISGQGGSDGRMSTNHLMNELSASFIWAQK